MAMQKLTLAPGVDVEKTPTLAAGGWSAANLIRFHNGMPEKRGGFAHVSPTPLLGICRALHAWADLGGNRWMGCGTTQRLTLQSGGALTDITPIFRSSDIVNALTTVGGSGTIMVNDPGHGANVGDWVSIANLVAVGGLLLQGLYQITTVIDANNYTFTAASPAVFSATGGATLVFTTAAGSNLITVTQAGVNFVTGQSITVGLATTVGGITLSGPYAITVTGGVASFNAIAVATTSATVAEDGGAVGLRYLIHSGTVSSAPDRGFGVGDYGLGDYGGSNAVSITLPPLVWSLDNFGQNLIACPTQGPLYAWVPPTTTVPAQLISQAPTLNIGVFVAMPQQMVVAFGSSTGSTIDPLLIRWCDQSDYTDWTATATNQAGSFRLSRGSTIVRGIQGPSAALIFTDLDVWGMQYLGPPLVWGFLQIANNCGLIAPKAVAIIGGTGDNPATIFWLSDKGPYMMGAAGVQPIPCSVWDILFYDLDTLNQSKCFAAANPRFNEVAFYFPSLSGGTGECDSYIKYNFLEKTWDYGREVRSAWNDQTFPGLPIGVDGNGLLQQHEVTFDADGAAMTDCFVRSGYQDMTNGQDYIVVDQLITDFKFQGPRPSVDVRLYILNFPGEANDTTNPPLVAGPFTVTPQTTYISLGTNGIKGLRARQIAIEYRSDGVGTWWRAGANRVRVQPAGRL